MRNTILNKLDSYIKIKVNGKMIDRFIRRLYTNKINIYEVKKLSRNSIILKINYYDYEKVNKLKNYI